MPQGALWASVAKIVIVGGVIALFGTAHFVTLPLLMLRALGAYRTNDAAAIAAIMLALTIAAFFLVPRLTARLAHAGA